MQKSSQKNWWTYERKKEEINIGKQYNIEIDIEHRD